MAHPDGSERQAIGMWVRSLGMKSGLDTEIFQHQSDTEAGGNINQHVHK